MNESLARLMVAVLDQMVCIKINGRADFTLSKDSEKLICELWERGYRRFVVELRHCVMMDSTYLGMLSGMALKFRHDGQAAESVLELLNPSPRIAEVLESLGVEHLFKITHCPDMLAANFEPMAQGDGLTKADVTRTCLEAHKILMALNPENVKKFKDVAQFLAEDLKRLELAEKK
jgi:anti-anti-sigma regulatory factor